MKRVSLVLVFVLIGTCFCEMPQPKLLQPTQLDEFEIISGSWSRQLRDLKYDAVGDAIYVTTGPSHQVFWFYTDFFSLDYTSFLERTFYYFSYSIATVVQSNYTLLWSLGTMTKYDTTITSSSGIPVQGYRVKYPNSVDKIVSSTPQIDFYAVADTMDLVDPDEAIGFFVGWQHVPSGDVQLVLSKVRASIDGGMSILVNETIALSTNQYTLFTPTRKPSLWYDEKKKLVFIAVPDLYTYIHVVDINTTNNMNLIKSVSDTYSYSSVVFDRLNSRLYFSYSSPLSLNKQMGFLRAFDLTNGTWIGGLFRLPLDDAYEPSVLAFDDATSTLYVALSGGPAIVKIIPAGVGNGWTVQGYARLPYMLSQVSSGIFVKGYLYLTTWETKGKLFRIHERHFCTNLCPLNGFCNSGSCQCDPGYQLDDSGNCIVPPPDYSQHTEGLAIAFIVLFVISSLAALAGFFLFLRQKNGTLGYQRVN